jgi:hypothetical protein
LISVTIRARLASSIIAIAFARSAGSAPRQWRPPAKELDFGAKLGQPNVAVCAGAGAKVVAETEEDQGADGGEDECREHATSRHGHSKFGS